MLLHWGLFCLMSLCWMSFLLSVTIKSVMLKEIMLSVTLLNVILLNVVAPFAIPHNLSNIGLHYFKEVRRKYSDCQLPEFSTKFSLARSSSNTDSVMKLLQKITNFIYFEICLWKVINVCKYIFFRASPNVIGGSLATLYNLAS
jgi:hypothetical protein